MKILIIDDSLLDRRLLMNFLNKAGFDNDVIQATDGEEGLRTLSQNLNEISMIFLDWQMPKMSGIDFMKTVCQVPEAARIPIVMISASGSDENKILARQTNPNLAGYLVKPYKHEDLVNVVKPILHP